ncbi:Rdx family-domain-containing protein [Biscogniauxia sp. FL1348]|nr:Rdx family-domain-containing protein [Biscogniauxia sp. FL1348]
MAETSGEPPSTLDGPFPLPRITIRFCTQCKWMLRAAYFAQELLSTFSTSLGEVALQPSTGGTFVVEIFTQTPPAPTPTPTPAPAPESNAPPSTSTTDPVAIQRRILWDRKVDGGFPETKELKRRVRDVIEPGRNLGHVDKDYSKTKAEGAALAADTKTPSSEGGPAACKPAGEKCEDCVMGMGVENRKCF